MVRQEKPKIQNTESMSYILQFLPEEGITEIPVPVKISNEQKMVLEMLADTTKDSMLNTVYIVNQFKFYILELQESYIGQGGNA